MYGENNTDNEYIPFLQAELKDIKDQLQRIEDLLKLAGGQEGAQDPVALFIEEMCDVDPALADSENNLFDSFELFRMTHHIKQKIPKRVFLMQLNLKGFQPFDGLERTTGRRSRGFQGIQLKRPQV